MIAQKGKRYEVVFLHDDVKQVFNIGDIVIALENDCLPWCVLESEYVEGLSVDNYPEDATMGMMSYGEKDYKPELSLLED